MKNIKKRIICAIVAFGLLMNTNIVSADCADDCSPSISTVNELEKEILDANDDNKVTTREKIELSENTTEEVKEEYIQKEVKRVFNGKWLRKKELVEFYENDYSETIDCGKGTFVKICFEDREEIDEENKGGVLTCLANLFITDVYAATKEANTKVKEYGNRYSKFSYFIVIPIGGVCISVENHYKIGNNGLTERYLTNDIECLAALCSVSCSSENITDKTASKVGHDINGSWKFSINASNYGLNLVGKLAKIDSTIKLVKLDKKNKKATVKQSYEADCYY